VSYPQGGYPQQQPYPVASGGRTNPATAVIAGLLALAVAAFEIVLLVKLFEAMGGFGSVSDLPAEVLTVLGMWTLAGLLLVLGSILTFARKMAGAVLIILGSVVAIAGFFLEAVLLLNSRIGFFLEAVFEFSDAATTCRALTLIVAPLALIAAVLPPTLNHLRGSGSDDYSGGPSSGGFQQQGYDQQGYGQQQGYGAPNSGGFPAQGYGGAPGSGGFPAQGYPQQQQPGGYPQQQGGYPPPQQPGGYPQQQGW
jgi:hypothetical protein